MPVVKLNIGGKVFQTTESTLKRFDGFFKTLLETSVPITRDKNDNYFIDRSSQHFEIILNYMRDGDVVLPDSDKSILEIQKEAQYYMLMGLVEICEKKIPKKVEKILKFLENENQLLEVIANITDKPVLVVYYTLEECNFFKYPRAMCIKKFLAIFAGRFEIYFKCDSASMKINKDDEDDEDGGWSYRIYDTTNGWAKSGNFENVLKDLPCYYMGRYIKIKNYKAK
ncbi:Protein CBG19646 [Caenorhabditis briggsae]|uniref:Protein CBG19532 n=2 Tax=Caenorhabditis briggsae TaxID=6238 RepID=G2J700_CAEBR|nr:Protein CBG19532 [Caenorhabditis briggsae]XP_002646939.1 Protein CBG19646 [Caenorhabditis briggsae]ULU07930.1 hypothetical protein L3Y34_019170 [Caenorhabditis briggsae]CAP36761.1 Protein CBG19532 [Caenorhabditis briggsae]CAP36854.1 Protein CBG19646 [Caenorhabditis briggsae]